MDTIITLAQRNLVSTFNYMDTAMHFDNVSYVIEEWATSAFFCALG